jgi:metallopeptidase family M12-like protein/Calx-beta domain-containing protein/uncharacterized protein DUF4214
MKEVFRLRGKAFQVKANSPSLRNKIVFTRPKFYVPFLLALAFLAILAAPGFYSPSGAQSKKARFEQDVEQVFTSHEDVRLDSPTVAQRVRESGRLSVQTPARDLEIVLSPNDLRAPNYRAEEVIDGGIVREVQMSRVNTYKGSVVGMPDADARFTVDDNAIEGMIITRDQSYFLESARKYSTSADAGDYLFYKASDVRPEITRTCGDTLDEQVNREAKQFASEFSSRVAPQVFSPFRVAEIATEADDEYVAALGGSTAANNDILGIMNQVQAIYERDIGLTFTVVFQHTWTGGDPYVTSGDSSAVLNEFTNYWNAHFAGTPRDVAHLWTGRNLGGPAGVAWMGVVCSSAQFSYGLSDLENMAPFRVGIPAHEIGHNFNASHCDGQPNCTDTIMVATQNPSNTLTFCPFSVNEITTYVTNNSSCLSQGAAPPTIQFSSSSYTVSETGPRVDITLTRSGNTSGAASVGFATIDDAGLTNCNVFNGIASPRCDYENTIGTATWAAGDATPKTFSVAIVDDSYAEGTETFRVSLNNPSGATLGAQSTATVTINDNDATNGPNPIDNTNFFVRQLYIDFLGREPDPPGLAGWTNTINTCAPGDTNCDRIHVAQLFFQSAEFQDRGYFVYRFYPVAFGRKPDYAEFVLDLASVSGFLDANQLEAAKVAFIAGFMARPAFAASYNGLTNQQYVDTLLNTAGVTLSNRQAMIDGLTNSSLTRAQVLRLIVESTEVATKYNHQAYAVMEYFGYLRRQPDAAYLAWIAVLDGSNDPRGMVTGFVNSPEYRNRFGP